ncbi:MAG: diguanylate cyclase, partial [Rugosibacter sp.]|nr:diguanylate cyclase [Rugosibacter sp.]
MTFQISAPKFHASLRTRFVLGLSAVLLPFLVAAALGQLYLLPRLIGPLDDIVHEFTVKLEPVTRLQTALLMVASPLKHYLIHGDAVESKRFAQLRQRVERAFQEISPERFTRAESYALIRAAREEWEQALPLGERLLRLPNPVDNTAMTRDMAQFDAHIEQAVFALDEAGDHFHRVIDRNRAQAGAARVRALWLTFAAFMLAAVVSLFAGVALARSITDPVDTLRQGATRLAEGQLSHRVVIHRNDELGELAAAFNTMAVRLEADQAALEQLATRDGLTGLYNHRTFYILLEDELARTQRFKRPVSLLLLDIDYFKRINDTHGHLTGDAVIRELGELLDREARTMDRVCRYGGEEITIILPETNLETAINVA